MPARGEGTIQAGGHEVHVLYTNRALADAEKTLQRSVIGVLQGFDSGQSGITEMAHLLRAGMQAARRDAKERGPAVTLNNALDVLDDAGFTVVAIEVMQAIATVLGYDGESENGSDPNW